MATTLDPHFNIAYRFGAIFLVEPAPGGPGRPDQAIALLREGAAGIAAEVAVHAGHRLRPLLGQARLQGGRRVVRARQRIPGAPWFLKPLAATTLAQGGERQRVARCCSRRSPSPARTTGCARTRSAGCGSSTRWTRSTSCAGRAALRDRGGAAPFTWDAARAAPAAARRARRSRRLHRSCSARGAATSSSAEGSTLGRCRPSRRRRAPRGAAVDDAAVRASLALALVGLTVGSFLNVCIYRIPRGESIVFPASRCTSCRQGRSLVSQHSGRELARAAAAAARSAARRSRRAIRRSKR